MTRRHRLTIRTRLTLWYAAMFVVTGIVLLGVVYVLASHTFVASNAELTVKLGILASTGFQDPASPDPSVPTESPSATGTRPAPSSVPGSASSACDMEDSSKTLAISPDTPLNVVPAKRYPEITEAVEASRREALRTILAESGLVFSLMSGLALLLCWLIASRALRPLRDITAVAERLSHDTLDRRMEHRGPADELKTLADTFNTMLDRLAKAFNAQRMFAANASHELRTPLTIIQTAAEMALSRPHRSETEYRTALTTIVAAASRSERLLASLLTLARFRQKRRRKRVDLAAVLRSATTDWPPQGPVLETEVKPAWLVADTVLLDLLVRNLLENATKYNIDSGRVWVRIGMNGDHVTMEVENTGPPVSPADIPTLRQPFRRGMNRTGGQDGHGLGLAIVDAVVEAHEGRWTVAAREKGGLAVVVELPTGDEEWKRGDSTGVRTRGD